MSAPTFIPSNTFVTPYLASHWYPTGVSVLASGLAVATDTVRLYPFVLRAPITVSDLGARVTIVGLGSFQLAIYANNNDTMRPTGAVLARTGDISSTTATTVSADITGANVQLAAGVTYWGATNVDTNSATALFSTIANASSFTSGLVGSPNLSSMSPSGGQSLFTLTTPMVYNTWSTMTGATFTEVGGVTGAAHIWLKAA